MPMRNKKEASMRHLLYWGSLVAIFSVSPFLLLSWLPINEDLSTIFFVGLFWLHMAVGHYVGYQGMLKRKYRALPWRAAYQRCLGRGYGVMGVGFLAAAFAPNGVGAYFIIFTAVPALLYINSSFHRLEQRHASAPQPPDRTTEE